MTRLWAIAVLTIVAVVACERVQLTSPTGSTITISADRNVLPLHGQATIRAVVMESGGTPVHNGTVVSFTTTLGTVNPAEVPTVNGVATATFNAGGISGTSIINAFSGAARTGSSSSSGNSSSGSGVEIRIGAAGASGIISVTASPPAVSQSGGTVTISAIVFDAANNPLPGVQVQFTASNGVLSGTTALTDSAGIARTTLNTTQTSTVTAFAGSAKGEVQVVVSAAPIVTIGAPDTGTVGTPVAITLTPSGGSSTNSSPRQIAQVTVNFGDGTSQTLHNITGQVGLTHTYRNAGGYTISAVASDVNGNTGISSKAVVINHAPIPTVTLSANPNPVPRANQGLTTFTVTTAPASTNVPIRNVRVTLQDGTVIYNGTGGGSFAYRFGGSGTYTATATVTDANGETATTSSAVLVQPW